MEKFDVVVIGGGPGGYPAAIRAAQLGAKTALVEREALGGTCLNWGCIPTKLLIAGGERLASIESAAQFGITAGSVSFDYGKLWARKNEVVGQLKDGVSGLLKANGVTGIKGTASFMDRNRIVVAGSKGQRLLETGKTILATGSRSVMPKLFPASPRIVDSKGFLDLQTLPASLIVVGGGVIGCEFACMAAHLGSAVTIVEMLPDILTILDADVRRELKRHMEKTLGIRILTGAALGDIADTGSAVRGKAGDETLEAALMLVAVGRAPVTDGLGLDKAGLAVTASGHIEVDAFGQTALASIFAIGDVTTGVQLAHRATTEGVAVAETAVTGKRIRLGRLVPSCIFTAPEVGAVGLTEDEAKAKGLAVKIGKFPFMALGKALASGHPEGFVKWVVDAATDRLVGAHAVGHGATELIAEACVAIQAELTAKEFAKTIHSHPTLSEAWVEAAHAVHGEAVHMVNRKKG
jgi:dihydrolipoamide dehydrogenase